MTVIIVILVLLVAVAVYIEHKSKKVGMDWKMTEPSKKGGSYSIYYMDKHIANVRGKMKALVLIHAIKGIDITDKLDMEVPMKKVKKVVKKMVKKVVKKKVTK